jgi:Emfourin
MRFTLTRRGGIGGMTRTTVVETAALSDQDASRLRTLLGAADLPLGRTDLTQDSDARDSFGYQLEVSDDRGGVRAITFDHRSATPAVKALVDAIRNLRGCSP